MTKNTVNYWIRQGQLAARRCHDGRFAVAFTDDVEAACWQRIADSRQLPHRDPHAPDRQDGELTVTAVADRLGISTHVVYYWLRHGQVHGHRNPAGRWCIPFPDDVEAACRQRIAASARIPKPHNT